MTYSAAAIRTVARLLENAGQAEAPTETADALDIPSPEEQKEAAAQLSPEQAKLVADNQGLLHTLANQFRNLKELGLEYEDIYSAAQWFMIKSALKYDPARLGSQGTPVPFGTWAARNIRLNLRDLYNKQVKYRDRNEFTLDGAEDVDDSGDDESPDSFAAVDAKTPTADQDAIQREKRALLQSLIDQMNDPLDKQIIQAMLDGADETNVTLGQKHGLVPTAIGNRRGRALANMRAKLQKMGIGPNESLDRILEPVPSAREISECLDRAGLAGLRAAKKMVAEGSNPKKRIVNGKLVDAPITKHKGSWADEEEERRRKGDKSVPPISKPKDDSVTLKGAK